MADIYIKADNTDKILHKLDDLTIKALTECGMVAEGHAKVNLTNNHSVDTGLLRNSVTYAISGESPAISSYKSNDGSESGTYSGVQGSANEKTVYIGTNVHYAPYVEMGTYKSPAKPYLRPAFSEHTDEYKKILSNVLGELGD